MRDCLLYVGGKWLPSASGETFVSENPATGEPVARLQQGSPSDVDTAVEAATIASAGFRRTTAWERAALCERVAATMTERRDDLARTLSAEQGKPLYSEAYREIDTAIRGFADAAGHAKHLTGETIPVSAPGKRVLSIRQPRGVYAVVTPWNFPVNIPTEYLAPALATGNTVVWVPAPTTSLCAILLAEVYEAAGIPPGVLNLITGPGAVVGDAAVAHPGTHAVGFTGSTATGHAIAARAAGKPLLLELGGNGPTIVFADANLEAAAESVAAACYVNAGQVCAASEVIFTERGVQKEFAELLAEQAQAIRIGDPSDSATTMGPLNNPAVAAKMDRHLQDATGRGARVLVGGGRAPSYGSDLFYDATVLADVPVEAALVAEESFGPVAPVVPFDDEDEVLRYSDAPQFGLCGSVWTANAGRAFRVAEALHTGIVNINESTSYWEIHLPFGGGSGTGSGLGRLGGMHTLREMTDVKTITMDITRF